MRDEGRRAAALVAAAVVVTLLVRIPFVGVSLSSDEAGFLMVGGQWTPGSSLYGDYWVDRPPGLIALMGLADLAGGGTALRLLGAAAAAASVAAAALVGRRVAPAHPWAAPACAAVAAALVSNPLLAVREVNGEALALPFLLLGTWMLCVWFEGGGPAWCGGAGVMAVAAASIKQNLVDVAVVALLMGLTLLAAHRVRRVVLGAVWFGLGAAMLAAALLVLAHSRGTGVGALWDAVVVFRWQAGEVISTEASSATRERAALLALAFVGTGAPVVLLLLGRLPWRGRPSADRAVVRLTWVVAGLLAWEGFSVVVGGSYWFHYLVALVPGLVLLVAVALRAGVGAPAPVAPAGGSRRTTRVPLVGLALAAVVGSTVVGLGIVAVHPRERPADEQAVVDYLRAQDQGERTGLLAFGRAEILHDAGLHSPYQYLWSLPVRVRDPSLQQLGEVLRGPSRPTWVVRTGASLASWGIDARGADVVIGRRYVQVFTSGDYQVLRERDAQSG